jgi:uncharacterized membrane protein SpoIIM required for sporulation
MRETKFINQNKKKWEEFEKILVSDTKDPDKLSNLFIQVSDDLSYSRTHYRNRMVRLYLNNLAQQIFTSLYKNKRTRFNRFGEFWKNELPQLMWESRRNLLVSFVVFILSVCIGVFSSHQDPEFPKLILGHHYVEMTKENIKNHDPMAVYKKMHEVDMFLGIALNNLMVSVLIFLFGLFFSVGTVALLIGNGVMVGAFQYFFYQQGLFAESALTIWMHGTLEMSAMVIAGAAGMSMGNGLVFPGTLTRLQSFTISSRRGLKILLGIAPIIVVAAIIEAFVTRYTELPTLLRLGVISLSLFFILLYFVWYPWKKYRKGFKSNLSEAPIRPAPAIKLELNEIHSNGDLFKNVFALYRKNFGRYFTTAFIFSTLYIVSILLFTGKEPFSQIINLGKHGSLGSIPFLKLVLPEFFNYEEYQPLIFYNIVLLGGFFFFITHFNNKDIHAEGQQRKNVLMGILKKITAFTLLSLLINLIILLQNGWTAFFLITLLPFLFLLASIVNEKPPSAGEGSIKRMLTLAFTDFWKFIGLFYLLVLVGLLFFFVIDTFFISAYFDFMSWNFILDSEMYNLVFHSFITWVFTLGLGLVFPILVTGMSLLYYSLNEIRFASALRKRITQVGFTDKELVR